MIASLADRRAERERKSLREGGMRSGWLGSEASDATGKAPDIFTFSHHNLGNEADSSLHPHVAMAGPVEAGAEAELKLAQVATQPDWSVELSYAQRGSAYSNMVSVMVRMDLPLFASRRQDPVTLSKSRQLEQVRAQAEDALRRHVSELRAAGGDWQVARARVQRYRKEIVPLVEERARLAPAAYEGPKPDLPPALHPPPPLIP